MESIIKTKLYTLPGTGGKVEISYPVNIGTLDEDEFLKICMNDDNKCSDNVWYSQFIKNFGIQFQQYKPSNNTWKTYYLWLNNWLEDQEEEEEL